MKRFLKIFLIALGVFALANIVMGVLTGALWLVGNRSVPERIILEVDLERGFIEYVPNDPVAQVTLSSLTRVRDVVDALEKASGDERVTGLIARVGVSRMGPAVVQELRDAVIAFRSHGKRAVAYAETFGDFGPGNGAYYLASAFDEIYLQPTGCLGLTGLIMEQPFLRGALDKLGVTPRLDRREEYKNAVNTFTEHGYTEPHRESVQQIMESVFSQIVEGVADARDLSEEQVRDLVDKGPLLAQEALDAGLVDGLLYRDEVYERVRKGAGGQFLYHGKYLARAGRPHAKGATVALIYGVGPVMRGASGYSPAFGPTMGSDTVTAAFRTAIKDNNVKAIIFRVDSPGGSAVASDTIWRETVRAREAGKPVIVSMGNLAGSGGYFVAMAADKIVAQPGTLTGSIGVFAGKMLTSGFWDKLGVAWDEVHTSENATMWAGTRDFSPEQWTRLEAFLDQIYEDFTDKVAEGRKLSKDRVLEIAKGRAWTGRDALALGLVDALGGYPDALRLAKEAAGIPEGAGVKVRVFPREQDVMEMGLEMAFGEGPDNSEGEGSAVAAFRIPGRLRPLMKALRRFGPGDDGGVLMMQDTSPKW